MTNTPQEGAGDATTIEALKLKICDVQLRGSFSDSDGRLEYYAGHDIAEAILAAIRKGDVPVIITTDERLTKSDADYLRKMLEEASTVEGDTIRDLRARLEKAEAERDALRQSVGEWQLAKYEEKIRGDALAKEVENYKQIVKEVSDILSGGLKEYPMFIQDLAEHVCDQRDRLAAMLRECRRFNLPDEMCDQVDALLAEVKP